MRHPAELRDDGGIDDGMTVTMSIRPDGSVAVEVLGTELVAQCAAMAFHEHQRCVIVRAPLPHGGERVPEVKLVEVCQ